MSGQRNILEDAMSSSGEGLLEVRPRTHSGGTLFRNSVSRIAGTLSLDKSEVFVEGEVGVYWDISAVVTHERDWIGMFEADEETPESFLDSRLRGENRAHHGRLSWYIDGERFRGRPTTEVCFCFYSHCNVLLARSPRLTVVNPEASPSSGRDPLTRNAITEPFQIRVTGLYCTGLRSKTFGHPDPYLKLHLTYDRGSPKLSHHGQRTASTIIHDSVYPCWTELFTFEALPSDILEIEVRDKFSATRPSISHFLGRVHVPLYQFLRWRGTTSLTFALKKRLPSDRVSGTISLSVENDHLEPRPEDIESLSESDSSPQIVETQPSTNHLLPPSGQLAVVQNITQDSHSSEEVEPAPTSTSDDVILLTCPSAEVEGDGVPIECNTGCQDAKHGSVEGEGTPSDGQYCSPLTSIQSSIAESMQENTSDGAQADVARQQSEDVPSISDAEQVVQKQMSDDPQLGQPNRLSWIRQTLYGSRSRRRDVSSLQRHHSLYTPGSHDRSHDFTTSVSVTAAVAQSHQDLPLDITESLPPNWEMRKNGSGLPMYFDHQNKVVMLEKPAGQTAAASSSSINDFLRRSSRNLYLRQTSNQPPEISNHQEFATVKLSRSQTVTGGFPGGKPRSAEPDEPVQPDQQDRIESGTTIPVAEIPLLEPADQQQGAAETVEGSEAAIDEVFVSEKEEYSEERVKSKNGDDHERVKVENEGSGTEGVKVEGDSDDGERSEGVMRTKSIDDDLRESPAFRFITRPDLYKFAKEDGNMEVFKDLTVLELLQTIRSDHALYVKYQHSSKLVHVLNSFAQTECDLPAGWEKKVDPRSKKHVFVDHNTRRTTFIDPRLPYPGNDLRILDMQQGVVMRSRPFVSSSEHQGRPHPSSTLSPRPPTPPPRPPHTLSPGDVSRLRSASFSHPRATSPLPPPPSPPHSHNNSPSVRPRQRIRSSSLTIISPPPSSPPIPIPPPPPPPPPPSLRTPPPIFASVSQQEQQDEMSYSDRVVAFLRQPNIFDLLRTRHESRISFSLRHAIELIRLEGTPALETMQSEMDSAYLDLTILLSLFEEEISHHIFPVASSRAGTSDAGGSHLPPPPPPPPPPPYPPPPAPTHTVPLLTEPAEQCPTEVDEADHTYAGIGIAEIIAFFLEARAYHIVLSRFNGITAVQREYIEWFQTGSPDSLEERLSRDADFRQFIFQLRNDVRPQPQRTSNSSNTAIDGTVLPNVENHTFAGISIADILEFFQREEEGGNILGMDLLMPLMTELTVEELEDLLTEDEDIRSLVIRHWDEIRASTNRQRPFPSSRDIQMYFGQPRIYSVVLEQLGTITLEDRAMIERIVSFEQEMLEERLLWDSILNRFIDTFSDEINAYATRPHVPEAPLPPPIQTNFAKPAPRRTEAQKERAFIDKLQALQRKLDRNGYASSDYLAQNVSIRRDHLLEDAYRFIMGSSAKQLRKKKCNLRWDREEGLDYGGPQREFFFKLSRQVFNPYYGLFEYSAHGSYTIQISPQSAQIEDALHWFRFGGRVIGYSIIQGHLLDVFFARHVYKALLGRSSYTLSDVEAMDIGFYNSLKYVLENDPEPLELTFTVLEESFGEMVEAELIPGGSEMAVTEDNRREYVDLMVQWRLARRVGPQTESLVRGLKEMLPLAYLEPFDAQELEWVIAGTPEINIDDWKENTLYWGGYHRNHTMIRWFWEVVEAYSNEQKLRLLQFVTGTSSIPFEGFKALRGSSSLQRFTIDMLHGPPDALPIAHTCFNRLDMPYYTTQDALREKLTFAIEECDSFENA